MVETSGCLFLGSRATGGGSKTHRAVQGRSGLVSKITRQARDRARDMSPVGRRPLGQAWGADRRSDETWMAFDVL